RLAVARVMVGAEHAEVCVAGRHAALELLEAARVDVTEGLDRAHSFLLRVIVVGRETPGGFEPPWHGLQPCASPLGHGVVEPPRGVEPLLAGSKPAALSSELRRRCSAGRRRLGRRRFQPQCPVYSRDASSSRWRRSYGSNSSTKACRKTRRAARSVSILCREVARPSSESTSKVNSMACELLDSSRIVRGSELYADTRRVAS